MDEDKLARIVAARMKLMQRFQDRIAQSPALTDPQPKGTGPKNRHGMPQLPVGQRRVEKWPVLDLGAHPRVNETQWKLTIDGAVASPVTLSWAEFMELPQTHDDSDFHCVTTWSKMDLSWRGVRFSDLMGLVNPLDTASHVMCHAYDGYTTNVALEEALKDDVLLVHTVDGRPLDLEHGGPCRMITPQLYAWKGAKWIKRIEVMTEDRPGFWEERGYSMTAHPWKNDRYR